MIPFNVDERGRVKLRFGDLFTLAANSRCACPPFKFIDAIYLGSTPETQALQSGSFNAEGHLFAKLEKHDELSFYLASSLKMAYFRNGDDDSRCAGGIYAWKTDRVNFSSSEREYVVSLLKRRSVN